MSKIVNIADNVHGVIQLSLFEKSIISTRSYNRLHDILQNSTAYLTYPSNRTSRFSHSLGVMHLSGQMFKHAFINADDDVKEHIINDTETLVTSIISDNTAWVNSHIDSGLVESFDSDKTSLYNLFNASSDIFYTSNLTVVLDKRTNYYFSVLWQAIRCCALLHDLGHPPFSHVVENALDTIYHRLQGKKTSEPDKFNASEELFLDIMDKIQAGSSKAKLHEKLTTKMGERLLSSCLDNYSKKNPSMYFFLFLVKHVSSIILSKEFDKNSEFLKGLLHIIDGPFDADRLDYSLRDNNASGIFHLSLPIERFMISLKLIMPSDEYDVNTYNVCPDVRSISLIESFLLARWNIYKYIVGHHRVKKTDTLLKHVVVDLALSHLSKNLPTNDIDKKLPDDISGLWRPLRNIISDERSFDELIQWNDSWLLTVLRRYLYSEDCNGIKPKLDELLSNKKHYFSLIKREKDFYSLEKIFGENFKKHKILNARYNEHPLSNYISNKIDKSSYKGLLFLMLGFYKSSPGEQGINEFKKIIKNTLNEVLGKNPYYLVFNEPNPGVKNNFPIICDGELMRLDDVSNIRETLNREMYSLPLFFVYVPNNGEIKDENKFSQDLLVEFGQKLVENFINDIKIGEEKCASA